MEEFKPILAIETTDELCSVALLLSEVSCAEINFRKKFIHSEKLMIMVSDLLKQAELNLSNLFAIAVSMGPGSFTGLRIGLTVAKGLAVGSNLPIIPVPTFDALAMQISSYLPDGSSFVISNNANINEVYFSKYSVENKLAKNHTPATLLEKSEIDSHIDSNDMLFGNFPLGNSRFPKSSPNASSVAKWSYIFGKDLVTFNYDFLEPDYLKNFIVKVKNENK